LTSNSANSVTNHHYLSQRYKIELGYKLTISMEPLVKTP
jgi:hypothetical protein